MYSIFLILCTSTVEPPPYRSDGYDKLPEHECVKMEDQEEDIPPPPYSISPWASRRCGKSCELSLMNVLLIIIMCLVAALLATYLIGTFLAGNRDQTPTMASQNNANETSVIPAKAETHGPVVTTQAPTTSPIPVVATQTPTKLPTPVVSTQAPTKPPTSVVTTQAPTRPPTQAIATQQSPTKAEWDWRSRGFFPLSCKNAILTGTVLSADCQTKFGSTEHSQLDLNCAITNVDGILQWAYRGTVANFKDSSRAHYITVEDGGDVTLHGKCQTMQGRLYVECSIVLNSGIENMDGELTPSDGQECTYALNVYTYESDEPADECILRIPLINICLF